MTRKDAIEAIKCNWPDSRYTILREALDMAVKALEDVTDRNVGKMTNADRIRAMSDEELAAWLTRIANGDVYTDFCCNPARTVVCDSKCVVCIAEWLKHPAKDGDDDD